MRRKIRGKHAAGDGFLDDTSLEDVPPDEVEPEVAEESEESVAGDIPARRDFFELEPEEVATYEPPGPPIAARRKLNVKPVLGVVAAALVVALPVAAVIILWPSSQASVPDLIGKTLTEAMDTARGRGFNPRVQGWTYSDKHSDGVVLSQEPGPGSLVKKGVDILITASKGPRPEVENPPAQATSPPQAGKDENRDVSSGPLSGRTVCIDPGHQAIVSQDEWSDPGMTRKNPPDPGAKGTATGNPEYLLTVDTGLKLKSLLEKDGIKVVLTRESSDIDITNITRAEIANNENADLYVRIHFNESADPAEKGTETLYPARTTWTEKVYERSKTAAIFIQAELAKSCGTVDLGISPRDDLAGLNWSKVPVVEPMAAFLSNPEEDCLLSDEEFRWKVAWGLRNGIAKYFTNM